MVINLLIDSKTNIHSLSENSCVSGVRRPRLTLTSLIFRQVRTPDGIFNRAQLTKALITIVIVLIGFIGCTDEYDLMIPSSDQIWPLSEDNEWTFDANVTLIDTFSIQSTVVLSVDSTFLWEDESPWYSLTMISDLIPLNLTYRLEDDGLHRLTISGDGETAINELYLKFPCDVSDSWTLSDGNTVRLLSNSDQLQSPVGDFSGCYRYRENLTVGGYNEISLFPGIGPIRMTYRIIIPLGEIPLMVTVKAELVDYKVKQD